jgi:hypothetical protein
LDVFDDDLEDTDGLVGVLDNFIMVKLVVVQRVEVVVNGGQAIDAFLNDFLMEADNIGLNLRAGTSVEIPQQIDAQLRNVFAAEPKKQCEKEKRGTAEEGRYSPSQNDFPKILNSDQIELLQVMLLPFPLQLSFSGVDVDEKSTEAF